MVRWHTSCHVPSSGLEFVLETAVYAFDARVGLDGV